MSSKESIYDLKIKCRKTGNCTDYNSYVKLEQDKLDIVTANLNQTAITNGLIVTTIGLIIVLIPFIKPLKWLFRFLIPKIIVAAPIIIGIAIGGFIGVFMNSSSCWKQECSPSALTTGIPILSLLATTPLSIMIYKKESK